MKKLSDPDFQASLVTKSIGLNMALAVVVAVFVVHDAWVWSNPPTNKYFIVDGKNPPRPVVALNSPIVSDAELLNWTVKAALAPYNVNYNDYPEQLNTAGRRFTRNGWNTFATSYISSGNFDAMKKGMLLCTAQAQRAAIITDSSVENGGLTYHIQIPIVQSCANSNQVSSQKLMLTAYVLRTNAEDHLDGLVIEQLIAVPV